MSTVPLVRHYMTASPAQIEYHYIFLQHHDSSVINAA